MKTKIILSFAVIALFISCQQTVATDVPKIRKGMIKVTILYPNVEGKKFDMDYYSNKHVPMISKLLGDSLKVATIDKGIANGKPDLPVPFLAIGYFYFDKLSAFQNSFGPNAEKITSDISNYTDIQPVIQISEVLQ